MTDTRRAWLDVSPLETRGVVELGGRPEHLLIEREGEAAFARLGARYAGRVAATALRGGFVDIGEGAAGWLAEAPAPVAGERLLVEVVAEARADKGPRVRRLGATEAAPGLIAAAPTIEATLCALAGAAVAQIGRGRPARDAADAAQEAALMVVHAFSGGWRLAIEPTRALVAIDVDVDPAVSASARRDIDRRAVREAARLTRLKGLGGTLALDLAGLRPDPAPLRAEAAQAFAADGPQVRVWPLAGPGVLMISKPHARRPLADRLLDPSGELALGARAAEIVRDLEREAAANPGSRFRVDASEPLHAPLSRALARLGPRFSIGDVLVEGAHRADIVEL